MLHMQRFFYDCILAHNWSSPPRLLMSDTDSLYVSLSDDPTAFELANLSKFDTSDYPKDHPCYSEANRKRVGTFKDECDHRPVREFVGLKAKLYSVQMYGEKDKATAKGIDRTYVKQYLSHESYMNSWRNMDRSKVSYYNIRSENHNLKTKKITKEGLNALDTKRYIEWDNCSTLAYGHYKIIKKAKS